MVCKHCFIALCLSYASEWFQLWSATWNFSNCPRCRWIAVICANISGLGKPSGGPTKLRRRSSFVCDWLTLYHLPSDTCFKDLGLSSGHLFWCMTCAGWWDRNTATGGRCLFCQQSAAVCYTALPCITCWSHFACLRPWLLDTHRLLALQQNNLTADTRQLLVWDWLSSEMHGYLATGHILLTCQIHHLYDCILVQWFYGVIGNINFSYYENCFRSTYTAPA